MDRTPKRAQWEAKPAEERLEELKKYLQSQIEKAKIHAAAYENPKDSGEQYCQDFFAGELNACKEILTYVELGGVL